MTLDEHEFIALQHALQRAVEARNVAALALREAYRAKLEARADKLAATHTIGLIETRLNHLIRHGVTDGGANVR